MKFVVLSFLKLLCYLVGVAEASVIFDSCIAMVFDSHVAEVFGSPIDKASDRTKYISLNNHVSLDQRLSI